MQVSEVKGAKYCLTKNLGISCTHVLIFIFMFSQPILATTARLRNEHTMITLAKITKLLHRKYSTILATHLITCYGRLVRIGKQSVLQLSCPHINFQNPQAVPDLDKERPQAIPLVRPLPIPHLHDWRKMFNKGEVDKGCLKFCKVECDVTQSCFCPPTFFGKNLRKSWMF